MNIIDERTEVQRELDHSKLLQNHSIRDREEELIKIAKEQETKKAEQKLSLIKEMLNKYQDPGDRLDKMVELQIQVNKLLEENATLKENVLPIFSVKNALCFSEQTISASIKVSSVIFPV